MLRSGTTALAEKDPGLSTGHGIINNYGVNIMTDRVLEEDAGVFGGPGDCKELSRRLHRRVSIMVIR